MKSYRNAGFSLIELMVALVIVGILVAVAMPSYSSYRVKSSRAAAQAELMNLASVQEKIYLNDSAYTANMTTAYNGHATTGGLGKTTGLTSDGKYTLTVVSPGQTFVISAKPVGGNQQAGNGCLTIQGNNLRQWYQSSDDCAGTATAW